MRSRIHIGSVALVMSFVLVACTSTDHAADAGQVPDAEWRDGGDAGDAGPVDGDRETTGDFDLGRDFGILVPDGTRMCTLFGTPDMVDEHNRKARLTPRPGLTRLARELQSFEDDWVEKLELGPDGAEAVAISAGTFQRQIEGLEQDGQYIYTFTQTFGLAGRVYQVYVNVAFDVEAGQALVPVRVADEYTLSNGAGAFESFRVTGMFDDEDWPRTFATCRFDLFKHGVMDLTVDNGDRAVLDLRILSCPPDMMCAGGAARGATVGADVTIDAEQRVVSDFFRLAFSHKHHGIFDYSYFVRFDEPVGQVHGLWIPEPETSIAPIEVRYLDSDLATIQVRQVAERVYTEP